MTDEQERLTNARDAADAVYDVAHNALISAREAYEVACAAQIKAHNEWYDVAYPEAAEERRKWNMGEVVIRPAGEFRIHEKGNVDSSEKLYIGGVIVHKEIHKRGIYDPR